MIKAFLLDEAERDLIGSEMAMPALPPVGGVIHYFDEDEIACDATVLRVEVEAVRVANWTTREAMGGPEIRIVCRPNVPPPTVPPQRRQVIG